MHRAVAVLVLVVLASAAGVPATRVAADEVPVRVLAPAPRDASFLGDPPGMSLLLLEGSTGQVIAAQDADRRRPIASAIKLVTALAVVEALPAGAIVTVGEEVAGIEGSSYGLRSGEVRTVEDLLAGLLLRSGNDAAVVLAHAVAGSEPAFLTNMQDVLRRLGIEASLASASGLEDGDALSAAELALVSRAALREPRIRDVVSVMELEVLGVGTVENRNLFVGQFAGATGLKTGFTSAAGYTLSASASRDGRELVAIVLGAPDDAARRAAAVRLLEYGFGQTRQGTAGGAVTLRTARGQVRFGVDGAAITVVNGTEALANWPTTLRPDDTPVAVEVTVDGLSAGLAGVVRRDDRAAQDDPTGSGIGPALVDGVYAALRPFGLAGALR